MTTHDDSTIAEDMLPADWDPRWERRREDLSNFSLDLPIGQGTFGKVYKATISNRRREGRVTEDVAVKMTTTKKTAAEFALLNEFYIMRKAGFHRNIIKVLGCCVKGGPFLLIFEYAPFGNLRDFLRKEHERSKNDHEQPTGLRSITQRDLGRFAMDLAGGMNFLVSKQIIHRDLAARNILVGLNRTMKIADFGLARNITNLQNYEQKSEDPVPFRWLALEVLLTNQYTHQSDMHVTSSNTP
ncbi:fibroblast growth factor receptor 2-like [Paramacrobiotus metropolitanus]|uniref:fibroblast growth factor receptor 2-like n=1 Tax=Paramacrobiotus metropolitanus TaxID=2943436 RepID=UPI0024463796|nr:fibroblast growth factor receptor 2-like [Paramacrobiotus metropolitanus]